MDQTIDEQLLALESRYKNLTHDQLAEKAMRIATMQLMASENFKKPRLARLAKYWRLYDGKVDKKLRQLYNIPIPVFSGLIDTLNAQYDTPIQLQFGPGDPSDYFKAEKIDAAWQSEMILNTQNSMWDAKLRLMRQHAIMNGRAIMEYRAQSDPEYKSVLENVNLKEFHFQPRGGLWLENHLFAGREGVEKSKNDLINGAKSGIYNKQQVVNLINRSGDRDYIPDVTNPEALSRFSPLNLDPNNNAFVGETIYRLVHFILEIDGKRWYICFEPWTMTWIRFEKWIDIDSSDLFPWETYATHQDDENFLPKAYSDDLYPVADGVITLFNQEITNREKRNNSPRGYDKDMVTDVRKLDEAAFRPDALIPFDTKGGTRKIADGVFEFKTGELNGTINLIDWMKTSTGTDIGTTDLSQGAVQDVSKKASVTFAEQKSVSKRLGWGAQPYQQMLAGLGRRYVYGLRDHMPSKMAIRVIGDKGWDWDEITRLDLSTSKDPDIKIISLDKQVADSELKKNARKDALVAIGADPLLAPVVSPKWRAEELLRTGDYEDVDIAEALDTQTFGSKRSLAHAAVAIKQFDEGKKPEMYYNADTAFMQKLIDVAKEKQAKDPQLAIKIIDYAMSHQQIVQQNMQQKAILIQQSQVAPATPATPAVPGATPATTPAPTPAMNPGVPPGVSRAINMAQQGA